MDSRRVFTRAEKYIDNHEQSNSRKKEGVSNLAAMLSLRAPFTGRLGSHRSPIRMPTTAEITRVAVDEVWPSARGHKTEQTLLSHHADNRRTGFVLPPADSSRVNGSHLFSWRFSSDAMGSCRMTRNKSSVGPRSNQEDSREQDAGGHLQRYEWRQRQEKQGLPLTTFLFGRDALLPDDTKDKRRTGSVIDHNTNVSQRSRLFCERHKHKRGQRFPQGCPD